MFTMMINYTFPVFKSAAVRLSTYLPTEAGERSHSKTRFRYKRVSRFTLTSFDPNGFVSAANGRERSNELTEHSKTAKQFAWLLYPSTAQGLRLVEYADCRKAYRGAIIRRRRDTSTRSQADAAKDPFEVRTADMTASTSSGPMRSRRITRWTSGSARSSSTLGSSPSHQRQARGLLCGLGRFRLDRNMASSPAVQGSSRAIERVPTFLKLPGFPLLRYGYAGRPAMSIRVFLHPHWVSTVDGGPHRKHLISKA